MTDIVTRLRDYTRDDHERGCRGREYDCSCGYDDRRDPLMLGAAYEIERLRAALREIIIHCDWPDRVENYARAALGGGDE